MDSRHPEAPDQRGWSCPARFDAGRLHDEVVAMYDRVARSPEAGGFHFHLGATYAVERLGYDAEALTRLPRACTRRFAGVGHPFAAGRVPEGAVVLDHACGAGTDLLLAALQAGPRGRAIGIDLTPAMRAYAIDGAHAAGLADRVQVFAGSFDRLPLAAAAVDRVISNGVLNLAVDKLQVLREVLRVLRPGGELFLSDVLLDRPLSAIARGNAALWAACVGGALTEAELHSLLVQAGFETPRIAARHACFAGTSLHDKFGPDLQPTSITVAVRKPG